jgi:hypothetical protein
MNESAFPRYKRLSRRIEGWLPLDAACFLHYCDGEQKRKEIVGNIFEIGVHHGRTTALLGLLIREAKERLIVNDIFDLQQFNVSTSGFGSEPIFQMNMRMCFSDTSFMTVIKKPSSALTREDTTDNCRIFIIDGGHTAEETLSDLETARRALAPRGLIMIDDYINMEFPGVSEGICRFLLAQEEIVPWVYGFNELFLVTREAIEFYNSLLVSNAFEVLCRRHHYIQKRVQFFGREILLLRKAAGLNQLIFLAEAQARKHPEVLEKIKSAPGFSWVRRLYQGLYRPK